MKKGFIVVLVLAFILMASMVTIASDKYWDTGGWATIKNYTSETGNDISEFNEAPMLKKKVEAGELPPVEDRLPAQPKVAAVAEEIGQYGGDWNQVWGGVNEPWPVNRLTMEGLVQFKWDGSEIVPNLAENWSVNDEGTVFTFNLKKDIKWSDGVPFTADDVLFLFKDVYMNKELNPSPPSWLLSGGKPPVVEKVDDYTVKFTFEIPSGLFLMQLARTGDFALAKHYFKQFHATYTANDKLEQTVKDEGYANWPQLFQAKNNQVTNPDMPVMFAWMVVTAPGQTRTIFERNPYYWKVDREGNQLPYIDRMVWDQIGDSEMYATKVIQGQVDCQSWHTNVTANYTLYKENEDKGGYRVLEYTHADGAKLLLMPNYNVADSVLNKLYHNDKFRKAISLAINREEMNELLYMGLGRPHQAALVKGVPYYDEEWANAYIDYDPDTAEAMLDEIGLDKKNSDGYRLRSDGKVLEITLECPANPQFSDPLELVAGYWQDIGIKANLKTMERSLYTERDRASKMDFKMWDNLDRMFPNFLLNPYRFIPINSGTESPWVEYGKWYESNGERGVKPSGDIRELQKLYTQVKKAADPAERDKLAKEIVNIEKENLFLIGTVTGVPFMRIVKNDFHNVPEHFISDWMPRWDHTEQFFIEQ